MAGDADWLVAFCFLPVGAVAALPDPPASLEEAGTEWEQLGAGPANVPGYQATGDHSCFLSRVILETSETRAVDSLWQVLGSGV